MGERGEAVMRMYSKTVTRRSSLRRRGAATGEKKLKPLLRMKSLNRRVLRDPREQELEK